MVQRLVLAARLLHAAPPDRVHAGTRVAVDGGHAGQAGQAGLVRRHPTSGAAGGVAPESRGPRGSVGDPASGARAAGVVPHGQVGSGREPHRPVARIATVARRAGWAVREPAATVALSRSATGMVAVPTVA